MSKQNKSVTNPCLEQVRIDEEKMTSRLQVGRMDGREFHGGQMPKAQSDELCGKSKIQKESVKFAGVSLQQELGCDESACSSSLCDFFAVPEIYMHDEIVNPELKQIAMSCYAEELLAHHMSRYLPYSLLYSSSNHHNLWFSIHRRVLESALKKALRAFRQLGLTQIEDRKGFLEEHCSGFLWFSHLSYRLFPKHYKSRVYQK